MTFLYVGRFTEVKRVPLLIEAFTPRTRAARRRDLARHRRRASRASGRASIPRDAIERLGADGVLLAGWHAQPALPDLLRASDVVVLPSVNESFGQVLVEGMACELPAIAVDRGGPAEIVDDGETGWLVAPDDVGRPRARDRRGRDGRAPSAGAAARSRAATCSPATRGAPRRTS